MAAAAPTVGTSPQRIDLARVGLVALLLLLVGFRVATVVITLDNPHAYEVKTGLGYDPARYHEIVEHDGRPYADFDVEYPPVTLAYLEVVNGPTLESTMRNLAWASLALDLVAAAALLYGWGRRAGAAYLCLGTPFYLLPFLLFRVDFLVVALAAWGIAWCRRQRPVAGGVGIALAALAKFWPLGLLPGLYAWGRRRALTACVGTLAAGGLAWFAWSGTAGPQQVLTFRGATGWQAESVVGSLVWVLGDGGLYRQSGAIRVGSAPAWATGALTLVLLVTVGALWWRVIRRGVPDSVGFGVAPLVATAAFLVCSPILSPQYVCWLLPFAAICWATGSRRMTALAGAAVVLTMLVVKTYGDRFMTGDASAHLLLLARNAVLVALVVEGFRTVVRAPAAQPFASARR